MDSTLWILSGTAILIAFIHTVMGPDHYLPFIMLGRANKWSAKKVAVVSMLCGIGHVLSSVILGAIGIIVGIAIRNLEYFESFRGEIASFLLIGFGIAYATWGIHQAIRNRPHSHSHLRPDGAKYFHKHTRSEDYSHAHPQEKPTTFWTIFIIFVLGPCEPLIHPFDVSGGNTRLDRDFDSHSPIRDCDYRNNDDHSCSWLSRPKVSDV